MRLDLSLQWTLLDSLYHATQIVVADKEAVRSERALLHFLQCNLRNTLDSNGKCLLLWCATQEEQENALKAEREKPKPTTTISLTRPTGETDTIATAEDRQQGVGLMSLPQRQNALGLL